MTAAALPETAPSPRGGRGRPRAGALDVLVGRRMRERRLALGLTVQELAAVLGVPYQQLHKYETGANRLSAGRLFLLAGALGVEVAHFFGGDGEGEVAAPTGQRRMLLDLARNFARIPDRQQREAVARLARTLADLGGDAGDGDDPAAPWRVPAVAGHPGRLAPEQGERGVEVGLLGRGPVAHRAQRQAGRGPQQGGGGGRESAAEGGERRRGRQAGVEPALEPQRHHDQPGPTPGARAGRAGLRAGDRRPPGGTGTVRGFIARPHSYFSPNLLSPGSHSMKPGPGQWYSATAPGAALRGPTRGRHPS